MSSPPPPVFSLTYPPTTPPPPQKYVLISTPAPFVLLVTINRPKAMNSLLAEACWEMDRLWDWFDGEPSLRVGIVTGAGDVAFSAGMDLKEPLSPSVLSSKTTPIYPPSGFAGLTRRTGKKPIISAVNGHAHGGGFEIALNSDLVLASSNATFCFPDVKRGTVALMGGLPRLTRGFGLQRAMGLALLGERLGAQEAREWGLVWKVVDGGKKELIDEAVKMASTIAGMSPDSIIVSRAGVREGLEAGSLEDATNATAIKYALPLMTGENVREGMLAFKEKREPKWVPSKL